MHVDGCPSCSPAIIAPARQGRLGVERCRRNIIARDYIGTNAEGRPYALVWSPPRCRKPASTHRAQPAGLRPEPTWTGNAHNAPRQHRQYTASTDTGRGEAGGRHRIREPRRQPQSITHNPAARHPTPAYGTPPHPARQKQKQTKEQTSKERHPSSKFSSKTTQFHPTPSFNTNLNTNTSISPN